MHVDTSGSPRETRRINIVLAPRAQRMIVTAFVRTLDEAHHIRCIPKMDDEMSAGFYVFIIWVHDQQKYVQHMRTAALL